MHNLALKKIKTPDTQAMTMQTVNTYRHDNRTTEKEAHAHNKVLPQPVPPKRDAGVTNYYDTFVLHSTLIFQISSAIGNIQTAMGNFKATIAK
ncbi:MAG: hypothetical protein HGGPFJEG_01022 [Ignavibacteria bacterium]|nr:hypothetical protein [Ignavibacteria bacterium]